MARQAAATPVSVPARRNWSEAEWAMRVDVAACYRLVEHFGMTDLVYNHITARVPGSDHHYLINPYGLMYDEVTASNLVKIDLDGRIVEDTPYDINRAGFVIHSAVHGARDDVVCVIHTHSRAGAAVSALEEGFVPVTQGAFQFYNRVAYHDYEGFALDLEERRRLVADLGQRRAMILRNHGLLTCGRSVAEAFRLIYYFEQACQTQLDAMHTGRPIRVPPPEVSEHTAQQWEGGAAGIGTGTGVYREWPALLRMLDRKDPSYKT
jgi:ribulose-5-phosphate 4-epimerase/fuculose-1-phosphate aldolase